MRWKDSFIFSTSTRTFLRETKKIGSTHADSKNYFIFSTSIRTFLREMKKIVVTLVTVLLIEKIFYFQYRYSYISTWNEEDCSYACQSCFILFYFKHSVSWGCVKTILLMISTTTRSLHSVTWPMESTCFLLSIRQVTEFELLAVVEIINKIVLTHPHDTPY